MKLIAISFFISTLIISGASSAAPSTNTATALKVFKQMLSKSKVSFCDKASFFSGNVSVRSGKGVICKKAPGKAGLVMPALAELACGGKGDFNGSHCDKNARAALSLAEGASQAEVRKVATAAFGDAVVHLPLSLKKMVNKLKNDHVVDEIPPVDESKNSDVEE